MVRRKHFLGLLGGGDRVSEGYEGSVDGFPERFRRSTHAPILQVFFMLYYCNQLHGKLSVIALE